MPRSRVRDPRVWLGILVTGFCLWLALRDTPFAEVWRVILSANWWVLWGVSIPAYVLVVYLRALRWRHLIDPIVRVEAGPMFRAVSVGFFANNIFPLRMGEFVRVWYLAREVQTSAAAILGTVILERVIDGVTLILLAFGLVALLGAGGGEGEIQRGALLLLPAALAPIAALTALRLAPDRVIGLALALLRPFPARIAERIERLLRSFADGLGALRGGRHLFWIGFHSLTIWLFASTLPFVAAFVALDLDLGSAFDTLVAGWITQVAVGVAVAVPSAPGFVGPYHVAARLVLERFGLPAETAVAVGTLMHAVFWLTLTGLGLLVLWVRRTSLSELDLAASSATSADSR